MKRQVWSSDWLKHVQPLLMVLAVILFSSCTYMKMNPPPDADKAVAANNNTCYLATAANMLAGAGYGNGTAVQARAEDIYGDLMGHFGTVNSGWTDTALTWWLGSSNNTWPNNPYTLVTVYGNKSPRYPWANANGAQKIGNELRKCDFVGLSISWPTNAVDAGGHPVIGSGGHAITAWGDRSRLPWKGYSAPINVNPTRVRLTDSDRDTGGDVQQYAYDSYTNPNPGGANEGNGWYLNYSANHPYIKHIVTLSPTQQAGGGANIQRVVGSYRIQQDKRGRATDLHYIVETDTDILSYHTMVNWHTDVPPAVKENQPRRTVLGVDWDFTKNPIPESKWVTITTEFVLRNWNAIRYDDVHFTYPDGIAGRVLAPVSWNIRSFEVANAAAIPNVTGGYVVASFDIINSSLPADSNLVGKYRLLHQYSFNQSPERHIFILKGKDGYQVTNLRFGHTYGFLGQQALWGFKDWMTNMRGRKYALSDAPVKIQIDWSGRLPYPRGEDIENRILDIKKGLLKKLNKSSHKK